MKIISQSVSLNTDCQNNELSKGIHAGKMSYQVAVSGAVQHPDDIGIFYCCCFLWMQKGNRE